MKAVWEHFGRNKARYGGLLFMLGSTLYTWGPEYHHAAELLMLAGTFLGGSLLKSDRDVKAAQVDAESFEKKVRELQ